MSGMIPDQEFAQLQSLEKMAHDTPFHFLILWFDLTFPSAEQLLT